MNAFDMLKQALREGGWDGLADPDMDCGCGLDDFIPCGQITAGCCPAKRRENKFYVQEET